MFSSSSRPRAPSVATLRVLYQLVYISSGTALGVGALCAEERRRRTAVIQRIADNAKRLHQCPRYNHGAAAAAFAEAENGYSPGHRQLYRAEQESSVLGPELPSVVSREYEGVYTRQELVGRRRYRRVGTRQNSTQPEDTEESGQKRAAKKVTESQRQRKDTSLRWQNGGDVLSVDQQVSDIGSSGRFRRALGNSCIDARQPFATTRVAQSSYSGGRYMDGSKPSLHADPDDRHIASRRKVLTHDENWRSIHRPLEAFRTHGSWPRIEKASSTHVVDAAEITADIELFTRLALPDAFDGPSLSPSDAEAACSGLLHLAASAGLMSDVTALMLWRFTVGSVSVETTTSIATVWKKLADKAGNRAVIGMVSKAFTIAAARQRDSESLLGMALAISTEYFEQCGNYRTGRRSIRFAPFSFARQHRQFEEAAVDMAKSLLLDNRLKPLLHLTMALPFRRLSVRDRQSLAAALFEDAVDHHRLTTCCAVVRWAAGSIFEGGIQAKDLDAFVIACAEHKAYKLIRALFTGSDYDTESNVAEVKRLIRSGLLSSKSCLHLAVAFAEPGHVNSAISRFSFAHLPERAKALVASRIVEAQAAFLDLEWERTRDFEHVFQQYRKARWIYRHGRAEDNAAVLHARIACIANEAGDLEVVASSLNSFDQKSELSFSAILARMMFLARRQDWRLGESLLKSYEQSHSPPARWTPKNMHTFRGLLQLYASEHTSEQTQQYCEHMRLVHGLRLDHVMTNTLLCKFVSEKRLDLLEQWLAQHSNHKDAKAVDGALSACLLHELARSHQVNHVWLALQTRDLLTLAPNLATQHLRTMLIRSITRDMRKDRVWRVGSKTNQAEQALKQILGSIELLRSPKNDQHAASDFSDVGTSVERPASVKETDTENATNDLERPEMPIVPSSVTSTFTGSDLGPEPHDQDDTDPAYEYTNERWTEDHSLERSSPFDLYSKESTAMTIDSVPALLRDPAMGPEFEKKELASYRAGTSMHRELPPDHDDMVDRVDFTRSRQAQPATQPTNPSDLHTRMMVEFTVGNYADVIAMYRDDTSHHGDIPVSLNALELAIESSLRLRDGQTEEAQELLSTAREAGMNVSRAAGPFLLHRIRRTTWMHEADAIGICQDVLNHYEQSAKDGQKVTHLLAVAAASKLIHSGWPSHGVELLTKMQDFSSAHNSQLDIGAMTVWMVGYGRLQDLGGLQKVVNRVLDTSMYLDRTFIQNLQQLKFFFSSSTNARRNNKMWTEASERQTAIRRIVLMKQQCIARRAEQRKDVRVFSRKLVEILAKYAQFREGQAPLVKKRLTYERSYARAPVVLAAAT